MKKFLLILLVGLLLIGLLSPTALARTETVMNQAGLIAELANPQTTVIQLGQNITLDTEIAILRNITIRSGPGGPFTLTQGVANSPHFSIAQPTGAARITLTLDNIELAGAANSGGVLVGRNGTLTMNTGAVIRNSGLLGGVVQVSNEGGIFNMNNGAVIRNNVTTDGTVHVAGTFTMGNGAVIRNNNTTTGGGVHVAGSGTFNMNSGAVIRENVAVNGGGVYVAGPVTGTPVTRNNFTMAGGAQILGNTATNGGGVHVTGRMNMTGAAIIEGNTANGSGGGVFVAVGGRVVNMPNGAAIRGNTAGNGGGVFVDDTTIIPAAQRPFTMAGGAIISGNRATTNGGGIFSSVLENLGINAGARFFNNSAGGGAFIPPATGQAGGIPVLNTDTSTSSFMTVNPRRPLNNWDINYTEGAPVSISFTVLVNARYRALLDFSGTDFTYSDGFYRHTGSRPTTGALYFLPPNFPVPTAQPGVAITWNRTGTWQGANAPGMSTADARSTPIFGTTTFTAVVADPRITVNLNANGGAFAPEVEDQVRVTRGSAYGALPEAVAGTGTRYGMAFGGWFTSQTLANGTDETGRVDGTTLVPQNATDPHTLWARWEFVPVTIQFINITYPDNPVAANQVLRGNHIINRGTVYRAALDWASTGLAAPSPGEWTLAGWATAPTGGIIITPETRVPAIATNSANPIRLYAQWISADEQPFTVTLNPNQGTFAPGATTTFTGIRGGTYAFLDTVSDPTRAGWDFLGWFFSPTDTRIWSDTPITETADHILYARWVQSPDITIQFRTNDGTFATAPVGYRNVEGRIGMPLGPAIAAVGVPTAPPGPNAHFQGWFTARTGGEQVTDATPIGDIRTPPGTGSVPVGDVLPIYARWGPAPAPQVVTFDPNGGTFTGASQMPTRTVQRPPGTPARTYAQAFNAQNVLQGGLSGQGTLDPPTRPGYNFTGWFTAAAGGTQVLHTTAVSADLTRTLFAQWSTSTRNITFIPNGGTPATSQTVSATIGANWNTVTPAVPTAPVGWTFAGWWTAPTGGTQLPTGGVIPAAGMDTFHARWTRNITFNANGGTMTTPSTVLVTRGQTWTEIAPTVGRDNYHLVGWYDAETGGTRMAGIVPDGQQSTVWARWIAARNVTFNANGGTFPIAGNPTMRIETAPLGGPYMDAFDTAGFPRNPGHYFAGWFTAAIGGIRVDATTSAHADSTLFARWVSDVDFESSPEQRLLTFNGNGGTPSIQQRVIHETATRANALAGVATPAGERSFVDWFTAETGGAPWTADVTEDLTLWARFEGEITFNANGGTFAVVGADDDPTSRTVESGRAGTFAAAIAAVGIPTREDTREFAGWFDTPSVFGGNEITEETLLSGNAPATLFARWGRLYEEHLAFMHGDDLGNFNPGANITRAEVATILVRTRLADSFVQDTLPPGMDEFDSFSDMEPGTWYFYYVAWAYDAGIIFGSPADDEGLIMNFRPEEYITRQELAAIIARTTELRAPGSPALRDWDQTSNWARGYVYTVFREGWMVGNVYQEFRPSYNITRAEVATAVNRMLSRVDSGPALTRANLQNPSDARSFPDVASGAWYFASVLAASNDHMLSRNVVGVIDWMEITE